MHFTPAYIACNERVEIKREEMRRDEVHVRREKREMKEVEKRRDSVTLIKLTADRRILSIQNTARHSNEYQEPFSKKKLME
jgi:hypothetical protein